MLTGRDTGTDDGVRRGIIRAITHGMTPGIGTTPGTMAITATTAVGILPGIMVATIVHTVIGDGTARDTMRALTMCRVEQAGSIPADPPTRESEAMETTDASTTAAAIVTDRLAMGRT